MQSQRTQQSRALGVFIFIQAHFDLSGLISKPGKKGAQSYENFHPPLGIEPGPSNYRAFMYVCLYVYIDRQIDMQIDRQEKEGVGETRREKQREGDQGNKGKNYETRIEFPS